MKPGLWYRVTKKSKNEEFQVGDLIQLLPDGDILSSTACGWMDKEDVDAATEGMEYELDSASNEKMKTYYEERITQLNDGIS